MRPPEPESTTRLLLFQICLLAEELGNHEGRLGWGEGSFYEKGTRGRQAHTRHQLEVQVEKYAPQLVRHLTHSTSKNNDGIRK